MSRTVLAVLSSHGGPRHSRGLADARRPASAQVRGREQSHGAMAGGSLAMTWVKPSSLQRLLPSSPWNVGSLANQFAWGGDVGAMPGPVVKLPCI